MAATVQRIPRIFLKGSGSDNRIKARIEDTATYNEVIGMTVEA